MHKCVEIGVGPWNLKNNRQVSSIERGMRCWDVLVEETAVNLIVLSENPGVAADYKGDKRGVIGSLTGKAGQSQDMESSHREKTGRLNLSTDPMFACYLVTN